MRLDVVEDEVTVGRDFDARGLAVFVRAAQGGQLARMDVNDLGKLRKARREQDGGVFPATREHELRGHVIQEMRRQPAFTQLPCWRCPQGRPFAGRPRPPVAGGRWHAGHEDAVGICEGKSRTPRGWGLLTSRLVDDDVAEEDAVVARDERGRVGAGYVTR